MRKILNRLRLMLSNNLQIESMSMEAAMRRRMVCLSFYDDGSSDTDMVGDYMLTSAQQQVIRNFELDQMQMALERFEALRRDAQTNVIAFPGSHEIH